VDESDEQLGLDPFRVTDPPGIGDGGDVLVEPALDRLGGSAGGLPSLGVFVDAHGLRDAVGADALRGHHVGVGGEHEQREPLGAADESADLPELIVGQVAAVDLLDAPLAPLGGHVRVELFSGRIGADQNCLDVGVVAVDGEREVSALVEVQEHPARVLETRRAASGEAVVRPMVARPLLDVAQPPDGTGGEPIERLREVRTARVLQRRLLRHAEELGDLGDAGEDVGGHNVTVPGRADSVLHFVRW